MPLEVDDFAVEFFDGAGRPTASFLHQPEAGPVYTDGSAHGAGTDFAAAAFAIIQLLGQEVGAG